MEILDGSVNKLIWSIEFISILMIYAKRFSKRLLMEPPTPEGFINFLLEPDTQVFNIDNKGLIWICGLDILQKKLCIGCIGWGRISLEVKKQVLKKIHDMFPGFTLVAYIKNGNQLSHRLAISLGFIPIKYQVDRTTYQKEG